MSLCRHCKQQFGGPARKQGAAMWGCRCMMSFCHHVVQAEEISVQLVKMFASASGGN